jgi:hypothetical protein
MTNRDVTYPVSVRDDELLGELAFADETGALTVPKGTTGQRPSPAVNGQIRYNDTTTEFEVYERGAWVSLLHTGVFVSTMSPSKTAAQNAAAFVADVDAAAGLLIRVPPGVYNLGEVVLSSKTINVEFAVGSTIVPDPALWPDKEMLDLTSCTTKIYGLYVDGNHNGAPIVVAAYQGSLEMYRTKIIDLGQASGSATTSGVYGIYANTCDRVVIDGYTGSDFRDIPNGIFGDQPGTTRHTFIFNCKTYLVKDVFISGGGEGDDVDFMHFLDTTPGTMIGTLENVTLRYSHRNRRCLKFQGGYNEARALDIAPGADFVAVVNSTNITGAANNGSGLIRLTVASTTNIVTGNTVVVSGVLGTTEANGTWVVTTINGTTLDLQGSTFANAYTSGGTANTQTEVGANCTTCIDWAANLKGSLRISNSRIDARGFGTAVANSAATVGGKIVMEDCDLIGSVLRSVRLNPETGAPSNSQTTAFYSLVGDEGSGMRNCYIKNFSRGAAALGHNNFLINCVFDDPVEIAWECGWTDSSNGFDLIGNRVITRTPGYLNNASDLCARVYNIKDARIFDNILIEEGNTTHDLIFIKATESTATGYHSRNLAPIGTNPFVVSSRDCGILPLEAPLVRVNTSGAINLGSGEDDLQSFDLQPYTLSVRGATFQSLNQRGVNILFHGRQVSNANAKTLKCYIGGTEILSQALTVSVAGNWRIEVDVVGTAASTQEYFGKATFTGAAGLEFTKTFLGTLALDSTAKITCKCTATAVADGDVYGEFHKITSF